MNNFNQLTISQYSQPQQQSIKPQPDSISAKLISQTPGRIRLKIASCYRYHPRLETAIKNLQDRLEIEQLRFNQQTGSITIFYGINSVNFGHIKLLLSKLGINIPKSTANTQLHPRKSRAALGVTNTANWFNQQVKQTTQGNVDLRFLVPLSFGVLATRQLLVKGIMLEAIPWYVLAWYAFDSFIKLHYTNDL